MARKSPSLISFWLGFHHQAPRHFFYKNEDDDPQKIYKKGLFKSQLPLFFKLLLTLLPFFKIIFF
jgi:hypothetical protein